MYEFDLIANKHHQKRMQTNTNKGEREGKESKQEAGGEGKKM